jgi:hypothetical protein
VRGQAIVRRARACALGVLIASIVPAAPGQAGSCPLVTDAAGDATPAHYGYATPADDQLGAKATDILSLDAWADGSRIHAVLRVGEVPGRTTVPRSHGHQWAARLRAEGGAITLYAIESNGYYDYNATWEAIVGSEDAGASAPVNLHNTTGELNAKTGEIRLSAPLPMFAPYTKVTAGVRWMPSAWSWMVLGPPAASAGVGGWGAYLGPGGVGNQADRADGKRPLTVGRPDCAR